MARRLIIILIEYYIQQGESSQPLTSVAVLCAIYMNI
jgi:hypothetical protein